MGRCELCGRSVNQYTALNAGVFSVCPEHGAQPVAVMTLTLRIPNTRTIGGGVRSTVAKLRNKMRSAKGAVRDFLDKPL
jgi:hypothetical protein